MDSSTLYCTLDAALKALRPLDGNPALSDETLSFVADTVMALRREQDRASDRIDAEEAALYDETNDDTAYDPEPAPSQVAAL